MNNDLLDRLARLSGWLYGEDRELDRQTIEEAIAALRAAETENTAWIVRWQQQSDRAERAETDLAIARTILADLVEPTVPLVDIRDRARAWLASVASTLTATESDE